MTKQIWRLKYIDGFTGNIQIVQIVVHVFKWKEALCLKDGRFVMLFDKSMQRLSSLKHNYTDEFTEFCVSYLFKFSCHC